MKILEKFSKLNYTQWKDVPTYHGGQDKILVNVGQDYAVPVIESMMLAKKISCKRKCAIDVLTYTKEMKPVYESFGIDHFMTFGKVKFFDKVKYCLKAIVFLFKIKNGDELLKYNVDGIPVGEVIYDIILRKIPGVYTIEKLKLRYLKVIAFSFLELNRAKAIMESGLYKTYIAFDIDYERSFFCSYAKKNGIEVRQVFVGLGIIHAEKSLKIIKPFQITPTVYDALIKYLSKETKERIIKEQFEGDSGGIDSTAYLEKVRYSEEQLYEKLSVKEKRKNVLVAAHAFSDSPHYGIEMIYKDYFEWLIETLKILSKNSRINTFVKEHPTAFFYGETGSVKYYIKKYNLNNVYVIPDDFSTYSAFDIMDYFVTCQGTIGLEAAIFKKPVFTAGGGYYRGFGIDIQSKTIAEYEERLLNITKYGATSDEIAEKAKNILCISKYYKFIEAPDLYPCCRFRDNVKTLMDLPYQYSEVCRAMESGGEMRGHFYSTILAERSVILSD